jgi:hypothetical protein
MAYHGPGPYYESAGFADYPPGFLLVLWPLGLLSLQLAPDDPSTVRLLSKLPAILADMALAITAYLVVRQAAGERAGLVAAALYTFNPITWFDSAIWGQVDALGALFLFLTVFSLGTRYSELSVLLGTLAILTKPQYIIVAPVIALILIRRHVFRPSDPADETPNKRDGPFHLVRRFPDYRRLATSILAGLVPACAILALFRQTPLDFVNHMRATADQYSYLSVNAFNPWAAFTVLRGGDIVNPLETFPWIFDGIQILWGTTAYSMGLALFVTSVAVATGCLWRRDDKVALWICVSVVALAFFVLPTRIHERYAFPFFALALPLAATSNRWLAAYIVLAVATFANMYAVYSLPTLANVGSYRPEILDATLFSGFGIVAISMVHTVGLLWVFWELGRSTKPSRERERQTATSDERAESREAVMVRA